MWNIDHLSTLWLSRNFNLFVQKFFWSSDLKKLQKMSKLKVFPEFFSYVNFISVKKNFHFPISLIHLITSPIPIFFKQVKKYKL